MSLNSHVYSKFTTNELLIRSKANWVNNSALHVYIFYVTLHQYMQ